MEQYMQLTSRLETIAKQVANGVTIADIGTDHAFIPIYLVKNNITKNIYACDINIGPLDMAKRQIDKYGYSKDITTILGEGLEPIKGLNVQNIIIAGMGGLLIKDIIDNDIKIAKAAEKLILQPMSFQEDLRRYLVQNGFIIIHEDLAQEDRRIYQIIVAQKGKSDSYDEIDYHISPNLIKDKHPLLKKLIASKERELIKIISSCDREVTYNAIKKSNECKILLEKIKEVGRCL
ncbi:SAM-dependent methyltransferase [Alkalibaculum sp. M08DMB]|uniref:SAM-dependent methyltransferase n=1 Tax=Alkalibaculum sporogenes TaxID=2655001 RepID=A0A6A7KBX4_9FIRM|nr:class I SAM-dependent methyltransferase [Alkalibaculum sporogenes]MPW27018.1 SAM-dependent methyltransferase [Alkalibaculum sporogenes]